MSRRYLAVLAFAAAVILSVGVFVRARLRHKDTPVAPAPLSAAAALQQLSQESQLQRTSDYIAERVAAFAPFVEYLPSAGVAGLRWGGDTVLSTLPAQPVLALRAPAADTLRPVPLIAPDSVRRDWVLVVGRRASGEVLSAVGLSGGRAVGRCAGQPVEEYVLGVPLHEGFTGAGLFDLSGRALGMVVRCGDRIVALPAAELRRLLAPAAASAVPRAHDLYGLAIAPLDSSARAYFGSDSGLLVTAVGRGSPADSAGLRAGDLITAVDGRPVPAEADPRLLDAATPADTHTVTRRRGRALGTVRLAPRVAGGTPPASAALGADAGLGFAASPPPRGVAITTVRPGSAAAAAGLRTGDRLLRIGNTPVRSETVARRLLATPNSTPILVIFDRDSTERSTILAPTREPARMSPRR